ncbi:MAG: hypothetical protein ACON4V_05480, partial [Parvibaculales bacterium]
MSVKVRVKVTSKNGIAAFQLFDLPQNYDDRVEWVLDREATDFDWLVVYDDLPPSGTERLTLNEELLPCPQEHTVLL